MRLKIISDGTSLGTKIIDAETGEVVDFVQRVDFSITVEGSARCTIEILQPAIDIECDVERLEGSE